MQVDKFGGASVSSPERMKALLPIISGSGTQKVVVVSAIGKTTNALEDVARAAFQGDREMAVSLSLAIEEAHISYCNELLHQADAQRVIGQLHEYFTEIQWAIDDAARRTYDYTYDQVVCIGELLSTKILSALLRQEDIPHQWIDMRDIVRTDDTYRDGNVDLHYSEQKARQTILPLLESGRIVIAQGFIGSTIDNASVTLGREGSDYSAALLGAWLFADKVTIWKDVEGLLNADPKEFNNTVKIEAITYHEVIEMAYYGAQVIHPKTIKPLQNHGIPLWVKCFLNKDLKGTIIENEVSNIFYPPLIVLKKDQVLLQVTTRDYSFMTEENLSKLYNIFARLKIKINLIQNAAISFVACIDKREDKEEALIADLEHDFKVFRNENVSLLTLRHYTPEIVFELTKGKYVLLEQKTRLTVQLVMK